GRRRPDLLSALLSARIAEKIKIIQNILLTETAENQRQASACEKVDAYLTSSLHTFKINEER
ncbi:MAG TPA: hypothetical protein DHU75_06575, partial [Rikenellaceae bacterium]|nr:hypothetical protein [Rikenellaceae bacterium]